MAQIEQSERHEAAAVGVCAADLASSNSYGKENAEAIRGLSKGGSCNTGLPDVQITDPEDGQRHSFHKPAADKPWTDEKGNEYEKVEVDKKTGNVTVQDSLNTYTYRPDGSEVVQGRSDGKTTNKDIVAPNHRGSQDTEYGEDGRLTEIRAGKFGQAVSYHREADGTWSESKNGETTGRRFESVEAREDGTIKAIDANRGYKVETKIDGSQTASGLLKTDRSGHITESGDKHIKYDDKGNVQSIAWSQNGEKYSYTKEGDHWRDENGKEIKSLNVEKSGDISVEEAHGYGSYTLRPDGSQIWTAGSAEKPLQKSITAANDADHQDVRYDAEGNATNISVRNDKTGKSTVYNREADGSWSETVDGKPSGRRFDSVESEDKHGSIKAVDANQKVVVTTLDGSRIES